MIIRQNRLRTITNILSAQIISSQEALQKALTQEGIYVTQATLSRDLRTLKVVKTTMANGTYKYLIPKGQAPMSDNVSTINTDIVRTAIKSIGFSGVLAVVKTKPGYASAVAYDIDVRGGLMILGTIAGDDTVLVVPNEGQTREVIKKMLEDLWNGK